ncbi:hypothetical protein D9M73_246040 [compost metagenome]
MHRSACGCRALSCVRQGLRSRCSWPGLIEQMKAILEGECERPVAVGQKLVIVVLVDLGIMVEFYGLIAGKPAPTGTCAGL